MTEILPATTTPPKSPSKAKRAFAAPSSPSNLATAILAITAEINPIDKRGHNEYAKYSFAKMPDVLRELAPKMAKHGILVTQNETDWGTNQDGVLRIKYAFDIMHAPTGEVLTLHRTGTLKVSGSSKGYNDKGSAAIATMTRKYVLIELFGCVVDDLPDGDTEGERVIKPAQPAPDVMTPAPEQPKPDPKLESDIMSWDAKLALSYVNAIPGQAANALREMFKSVPRNLWDYLLPSVNDRHLPAATELDARHAKDLNDFRA